MGRRRATEPLKYCKLCRTKLERRLFNGRLEDLGVFKKRKFCSLHCANTKVRPEHWETYHWRARKYRGSSCEACGSTDNLHAHHVDGNPKNSEAENIQILCIFCHGFLHATAHRHGWTQPGRLPNLLGFTDLNASVMPLSLKSQKSYSEG